MKAREHSMEEHAHDSDTEGGSDGAAEGMLPSSVYSGRSESGVVAAFVEE
jgi:hypothetical protein